VRTLAVAVLGTASNVGKSAVCVALCRLLHRAGVRVAPFKAQNLSNESVACTSGGEIGRAQAMQAAACGLTPCVEMNPVLLKPEANGSMEVVVLGRPLRRVHSSSSSASASSSTPDFSGSSLKKENSKTSWEKRFAVIREAYDRLASQFEVIVIEGAGSCAELNLMSTEVPNWPVVRHANAHVLLVGDVSRGGVFAQLLGTLALLPAVDRARVRGLLVNRFHGDPALFDEGVHLLQERSGGVPVLGVLSHLEGVCLGEEDELAVCTRCHCRHSATVMSPPSPSSAATQLHLLYIVVIRLPHLSNHADLCALEREEDVCVRYLDQPDWIGETAPPAPHCIVIPGTKDTLADLQWLHASGWARTLQQTAARCGATELVGICGGLQMLGEQLRPEEGDGPAVAGLSLLPGLCTVFRPHREKTVRLVAGQWLGAGPADPLRGLEVHGYEVHTGLSTTPSVNATESVLSPLIALHTDRGTPSHNTDGYVRTDRCHCWGTYMHGVWDSHTFRGAWLDRLRERAGWSPLDKRRRSLTAASDVQVAAEDLELDRFALHVASCCPLLLPSLFGSLLCSTTSLIDWHTEQA